MLLTGYAGDICRYISGYYYFVTPAQTELCHIYVSLQMCQGHLECSAAVQVCRAAWTAEAAKICIQHEAQRRSARTHTGIHVSFGICTIFVIVSWYSGFTFPPLLYDHYVS